MTAHRPVIMAPNGIVASGHPLASQAGINVLQKGGNAFDAAIAAAAVVAVCKPAMNGLGADNMALIWDARGEELFALNSNGHAPRAATLDAYRDGIPERGPRSAAVPGAVAGWEAILSRFGTKQLSELLQPAIAYAESGFPVNRVLHQQLQAAQASLTEWPNTAAIFLPEGKVPQPGDMLCQKDLAATLKVLAAKGARSFYEGEIAQRMGEAVSASGGLISAADLADFRPQWKDAVYASYRDVEFYGQPPTSQGFIIAEELNILQGFEPRSMAPVDLIHTMVEAKKLAFADRARYLADPSFNTVPVEALLSKEHALRQRNRINPHEPAAAVDALDLTASGGETTYLCAVDASGNAISFIQSIFHVFGSCFVAGDTGILLNDRLLGLNTRPGDPNCVEPGKRPLMTLNACMLFRNDKPWVVFGTPGADAQVQTNFQHAVDWVDFDMDVQTAIEAPRWCHLPDNRLLIETRYPAEVIGGLKARGHDVRLGSDWDETTGGAQAIMIDPRTGVLHGGADPRREGYAIGY